jgi:hypothetical protein
LSSSRPLVFIRGKGGDRATLPSVHSWRKGRVAEWPLGSRP